MCAVVGRLAVAAGVGLAAIVGLGLRAVCARDAAVALLGVAGAAAVLALAVLNLVLIGIGAGLRLAHFSINRSLWLDEVLLARNIVDRSLAHLFQPLDNSQGAPLGFLLLEKLAVALLGPGETGLRLMPLLAALATLPMFAALTRRLLRSPARYVALSLFALSPSLVYYAAETKQYAFDVFVAVGLYLVTDRIDADSNRRTLVLLAALGACAIWLSHASVFVLCGIGTALVMRGIARGNRQFTVGLFVVILLWLVSFAAELAVSLTNLGTNQFLRSYWDAGFLPWPIRYRADLDRWAGAFLELFRVALTIGTSSSVPVGMGAGVGALAVCTLGVSHLSRRHRIMAAAFAVTMVTALGAAALRQYPFQGRLILFTVPMGCCLSAAAFEELLDWPGGAAKRVAAAALAVGLLGFPLVGLAQFFHQPYREELRPILYELHDQVRAGDSVYVHSGALHAFFFYTKYCERCAIRTPHIRPASFVRQPPDYGPLVADVEALRGQSRVWAVFAHVWGRSPHEKEFLLHQFDRRGKQLLRLEATGASAYLYDLSGHESRADQ